MSSRESNSRPPKPSAIPASCDWGDCDELASDYRWSCMHGWLPVCKVHGDSDRILRLVKGDPNA